MMKRLMPTLAACALLFGCAGSQVQLEFLKTLVAKHLIVSMPEEIPFPNDLTLVLDQGSAAGQATAFGNQMLQAMGSSSLEQKIGRLVRQSSSSLRRDTAEAFARELRGAAIFAGVNHEGGEAQISVGVSRWGLVYNADLSRYEPVLDMEASLSVPPFGQVWKATRSVADLSSALSSQLGGIDISAVSTRPETFIQSLNLISADLSRQLVEDLRNKTK